VSRYSKRSILNQWRSTMSGTVVCLSCWSAVPSATAQEAESSGLMAFLSVPTTTATCSGTNLNERVDPQTLTGREVQPMRMSQGKPTDIEAWEGFEAEYKPPQKSVSPIKREIETAKYGLDTAVFAVNRFVASVKNQADFSFDQGSLHRTRASSSGELLSNLRVKLDLDMGQSTKPYVGVRLVIPFGK